VGPSEGVGATAVVHISLGDIPINCGPCLMSGLASQPRTRSKLISAFLSVSVWGGEVKIIISMISKEQGWYHTPAHRRWRKLVLQRDKICQMCKRKPASEAHHIKPLEDYPELALDLDNGQGLCWDCHELTKYKKKKVMPKGIRIIKA
jgi:5-methylcytosine-specific restriction protein A